MLIGVSVISGRGEIFKETGKVLAKKFVDLHCTPLELHLKNTLNSQTSRNPGRDGVCIWSSGFV